MRRPVGSIGAWASLSIKGHVLSLSYAFAIANYSVRLPKRQRMSCELISVEIVLSCQRSFTVKRRLELVCHDYVAAVGYSVKEFNLYSVDGVVPLSLSSISRICFPVGFIGDLYTSY